LVMVTVTPVIRAPLPSRTSPSISPVRFWACKGMASAPVSRATGGISEFVKRRWLARLSAKVDGVENAAAYTLLPQSVIDTDAEATDIYVHLRRLVVSTIETRMPGVPSLSSLAIQGRPVQ